MGSIAVSFSVVVSLSPGITFPEHETVLAGKSLFRDFEDSRKQLDDDEDVVVGMGRCSDLIGRYAVENSVCRTPSERMTVRELQTLLKQLNGGH